MELDQNRSMWSCSLLAQVYTRHKLLGIPSSLFDRDEWDSGGRILNSQLGGASPDYQALPTRSSGGGDGFVTDEKVQVFSSTLRVEVASRPCTAGEVRGLVRNGRST